MPRRSTRRLGILMMLALATIPLAPAPRADATVVIPITFQELAATADAIARGRIIRVDARQTASRRVERLITFEPVEYLKGQLGGLVQFPLPGGTFGRYRTIAVGAPEFKEGDEVVLFFAQRPNAAPILLGFHQGIYRVVLNAAGERVVTPPVLQELPQPSSQTSPHAVPDQAAQASARARSGMSSPSAWPPAASSRATGSPSAPASSEAATGTPIVRGDLARRPLPWNQFHAQVMAAIAAAPGPPRAAAAASPSASAAQRSRP